MTDKTVPVPVELLQEIEDGVFYPSGSPLARLRDFIPAPSPKVGDAITEDTIKELPNGSVLRDNVDDIWVVGSTGRLFYANLQRSAPAFFELHLPSFSEYKPVLVSLPRD